MKIFNFRTDEYDGHTYLVLADSEKKARELLSKYYKNRNVSKEEIGNVDLMGTLGIDKPRVMGSINWAETGDSQSLTD